MPGYAARPREATHIVRDDHLRATSDGELHDVEADRRTGLEAISGAHARESPKLGPRPEGGVRVALGPVGWQN